MYCPYHIAKRTQIKQKEAVRLGLVIQISGEITFTIQLAMTMLENYFQLNTEIVFARRLN